jgi:uncharacterized protein
VKNANLVSRFLGCLVLGLATVFLAGCPKEKPAAPSAPKTIADFFPIKVGDKTVRVQIAILDAEMERGLMGRLDLGKDDGMIFVFAQPRRMSFWMKNTPTPLDIGYFTPDAELAEVYQAFPLDERPIPSRSLRIQYVLEMNQGWYRANGVQPGAKFDVKALAAAVKARGFEPWRFGLEK